jgi:hypothetical protein
MDLGLGSVDSMLLAGWLCRLYENMVAVVVLVVLVLLLSAILTRSVM